MPVRLDTGERRGTGLNFGSTDSIPAAVLVLIAPDRDPAEDADAEVILIQRVARGGHHSGEMSLPGGRVEPSDGSDAYAALREAAEEVALDADAAGVRVVGELEPFWIPVSGYRVTPIVAIAARRPALAPSPAEVVAIVRAPLDAFLPGAPIELVETTVRGIPIRFGAYPVAGHRVWGATARILGQLGATVGEGGA
ncbi:MAG: CoA pyrophosphatase [Chloroflexi bacterium]|nr:CoA pyrophosphatase [Chloroflexota bacterium]